MACWELSGSKGGVELEEGEEHIGVGDHVGWEVREENFGMRDRSLSMQKSTSNTTNLTNNRPVFAALLSLAWTSGTLLWRTQHGIGRWIRNGRWSRLFDGSIGLLLQEEQVRNVTPAAKVPTKSKLGPIRYSKKLVFTQDMSSVCSFLEYKNYIFLGKRQAWCRLDVGGALGFWTGGGL